jgi:hypothetical protein
MFRRSLFALVVKTLQNGTVLDGTFANDRFVEGVAKLPDGRVFKGKFSPDNGAPSPGSQLEEDGDLYRGEYNERWQRHGQGKAFLLDGTEYIGQFHEDEFVKGKVIVPDGTDTVIFEGTLKDEEFVQGSLKAKDYRYVGEFKANTPHGKGKLTFNSGAYMEGTFFKGRLNGPDNKVRLDNGDMYIGDFLDGRIRRGELRTATFNYEGEFDEHGMPDGPGRKESLDCYPKIISTGRWVHGQMLFGSSEDEFGNAVDYLGEDRAQLSSRDPVKDAKRAEERNRSNALLTLMKAVVQDANQAEADRETEYHKSAQETYEQSGRYPREEEIGFQPSDPTKSDDAQIRRQNRQEEFVGRFAEHRKEANERIDTIAKELDEHGVALNRKTAEEACLRQIAFNHIQQGRLNEQAENFKKEKMKKAAEGSAAPGGSVGLNPTWKNTSVL